MRNLRGGRLQELNLGPSLLYAKHVASHSAAPSPGAEHAPLAPDVRFWYIAMQARVQSDGLWCALTFRRLLRAFSQHFLTQVQGAHLKLWTEGRDLNSYDSSSTWLKHSHSEINYLPKRE